MNRIESNKWRERQPEAAAGHRQLCDGSLGLFKFYVLLFSMLETSFSEKPKVFLYFNKPPTRCAGEHLAHSRSISVDDDDRQWQ